MAVVVGRVLSRSSASPKLIREIKLPLIKRSRWWVPKKKLSTGRNWEEKREESMEGEEEGGEEKE